ncbi:MAG: 1-deoxy-D-xylulose-5-phosphate reductoisomerase [Verrucomicrobiota bacterium]|nr:1-deoxy-D-xylulose-5-phosphate reductoisomerase [Verrucomicrobiota bacterium]
MKNIIILGVTGSIGKSAVDVVEKNKDKFNVIAVAGGSNYKKTAEIAAKFNCRYASVADSANSKSFEYMLPSACIALYGKEALLQMTSLPEVDLILCAISGTAGFYPVLNAIRLKKTIALASKEIMVMAGNIIMEESEKAQNPIIPVDSEHSAIFQCLNSQSRKDEIDRLILTASGGPFLRTPQKQLTKITKKEALAHPTWDMGEKITVDSATLMNKALELIEAHWLFNVDGKKLDVLIHPQSIIHSMVEFVDGSTLAQMGPADMRLPIIYALSYPERIKTDFPRLNLSQIGQLNFEKPDTIRFPALKIAEHVIITGGTLGAVFNASNEVAVEYFLKDKIYFPEIWESVGKIIEMHKVIQTKDIDEILDADSWARRKTAEYINLKVR